MITLVREINGCLELRDEIEERRIDHRYRARQRSLELIVRGARLQRRRSVDQIADRFGLNEIDPAVQKRAKCELARLGEPRAGIDCRCTIARSTTGLPCALSSTTSSPV